MASSSARRRELRERAIQYLGGKCIICGYSRCFSSLHFHHRETWSKAFTIADKLTSWERIKPELDKTSLLCSNCHGEVHEGLHFSMVEYEPARGIDYDDPSPPEE